MSDFIILNVLLVGFLILGSVRQIKLTYVIFLAHVKIAFRVVSQPFTTVVGDGRTTSSRRRNSSVYGGGGGGV